MTPFEGVGAVVPSGKSSCSTDLARTRMWPHSSRASTPYPSSSALRVQASDERRAAKHSVGAGSVAGHIKDHSRAAFGAGILSLSADKAEDREAHVHSDIDLAVPADHPRGDARGDPLRV